MTEPDKVASSEDVVLWRTFRPAMVAHRRVLVVDDYRDAAEALQLLLDADGFECRATSDPHSACTIAREWQPFAVMLDIAMPGIDGLELARRLRADSATTHMVLIACTGYASAEDRARAREAGFDAHCAKPLTPELILRVLEFASEGDRPPPISPPGASGDTAS
ncbi:MAG TPA: response regulator [Trinickia sp.]|nr:response regulator [Trinickia sp.]